MARPLKLRIDTAALLHNLATVAEYAPNTPRICCVKANAYGHGLVEVAQVLAAGGAEALAVAGLEEALALRKTGIKLPILALEGPFTAAELQEMAAQQIWTVIHSDQQLAWLQKAHPPQPLDIWLKVDTGMHRLGFAPQRLPNIYRQLTPLPQVARIRLMTHFACASDLANPFTAEQNARFEQATAGLVAERSLANSPAIIGWPQTHADWIRPGLMLYGISPFGQAHPAAARLKPAMQVDSAVIAVRELQAGDAVGYNHRWRATTPARIAVVAAGYGDGYPRNTENGTPALVNGQQAKVVGRVAMDMLTLDVSGIADVAVGSPVELWGTNLSVNDVAAHSGYSPYELLARIPARPERSYYAGTP